MRAIRVREPGGPEVLELVEREDPVAGAGEVRVRVRCAGINRADLLQRLGRYPAPADAPPDIPGLEFAGEIEAVGSGVDGWSAGDRAMGILGGGGYAERVTVPAGQLLPVPPTLSWTEAGAIPEVFLTAADALIERGRLRPGETVLVHTAGGGVGTAALQLARASGAGSIIATASAAKLDRIREAGLPCDLAVDRRAGSFADAVARHTDRGGTDVILDTVGAPYWEANIASLATLGRLVIVGVMGGMKVEANLRTLMGKRATVVGTVLRARSKAEKAHLTEMFATRFLPGFTAPETDPSHLRPVIDRVFPLAGAAEAHRYVESNQSFGKVLLDTDP
ncbi:MAG: NAD(P)H-quinone oxidoreductase [Gemmatimonadales bacterium]|nr:NAD(P)H-quinone oxidoreductase [Gemmatimonadales bacterium]MYK00882.1 NAD(P)H-quinone oxidoreductase [Candidatus Palauibacter ramosifaciens]